MLVLDTNVIYHIYSLMDLFKLQMLLASLATWLPG